MVDPQSYRPTNLPSDPGVYRFFDKDEKVIYVEIITRIHKEIGRNIFQPNLIN